MKERVIADYNALLRGKTAFVTTAARGIGLSIARLFVRQGATVYFAGRNAGHVQRAQAALQRDNPACRGYVCDLADAGQSEATALEALADSGGFDILVGTVGVNCHCTVEDYADADMARLLETNYLSGLRFARRFMPSLRARKGSVVFVSSIHSALTQPTNMLYAGTKGAMNAAARAMALDFAKDGVRVNTVCPGLILSDVMRDLMDGMETQAEKEAFLRHCDRCQPLPAGCMEDIANAALYFASDMSAYVTGQTLMVDGGTSVKAHDFWMETEG